MYSPDGRWWWNGAEWIPAPQWRARYETTPWTRKLQAAVLALQAVALAVAAVSIPGVFSSVLSNNAAMAGDPQTAELFRQTFLGAMVFAGMMSLAILAVLVVGVLKLWRWLYWYLMISYGFAVLSIPLTLITAFGGGLIVYPRWYWYASLPVAVCEVALCAWMAIALRRYGPWARRTIVEPV